MLDAAGHFYIMSTTRIYIDKRYQYFQIKLPFDICSEERRQWMGGASLEIRAPTPDISGMDSKFELEYSAALYLDRVFFLNLGFFPRSGFDLIQV